MFLRLCVVEKIRSGFACLVIASICCGWLSLNAPDFLENSQRWVGKAIVALPISLALWACAPLWVIVDGILCWLNEALSMSPCAGPNEMTLYGKIQDQLGI